MKKIKISYLKVLIFTIGLLMFVACISEWIIAVIHGGTFTIFGLIINFVEMLVSAFCYEYLFD